MNGVYVVKGVKGNGKQGYCIAYMDEDLHDCYMAEFSDRKTADVVVEALLNIKSSKFYRSNLEGWLSST